MSTNPNPGIHQYAPSTLPREREREGATSSPQRNLLEFLCICVACIVCYYNSTQCGLVFDDISAIRDNKDLRPHTPLINVFLNDFWGRRCARSSPTSLIAHSPC